MLFCELKSLKLMLNFLQVIDATYSHDYGWRNNIDCEAVARDCPEDYEFIVLRNPLECCCFEPLSPPARNHTCPQVYKCPGAQQFDYSLCRCVCSDNAAEMCSSAQTLNPNTCQCECPRSRSRRCYNSLQRFNEETCRCECVRVIPAYNPRTSDTSDSSRSGSTRHTGSTRRSVSTRYPGTTRRSGSTRYPGTTRRSGSTRHSGSTGTTRRSGSHPHRHRRSGYRSGTEGSRSRSTSSRDHSSSRSSSTTGSHESTTRGSMFPDKCPPGQRLWTYTCQCYYGYY